MWHRGITSAISVGFFPDPVQFIAHFAGMFHVVVGVVRLGTGQFVLSGFIQNRTAAGFGGHPPGRLGIGLETLHL